MRESDTLEMAEVSKKSLKQKKWWPHLTILVADRLKSRVAFSLEQ